MRLVPLSVVLAGLALPTMAAAQAYERVNAFAIVKHAKPLEQLFILGLVVWTVAAVVICVLKLLQRTATGGSAFVSGLRMGGPIIGLLGLVYGVFATFLGIAMGNTTNLAVLSPGIATALLTLFLGLLAGALAILGHTLLESRIDRALLKA